MDCPDCERLAVEENEASTFLEVAHVALRATIPKVGEEWARSEMERWKMLDAEAEAAHQWLRQVKRKKMEHRATHLTLATR
jgi:hypothetical protein